MLFRSYFQTPFYGGQQVTVLASVGHTVKSQTPRNGAAIWVETVTASEFTACVLEFGNGSNRTVEVNWLSFQASLQGSWFLVPWFPRSFVSPFLRSFVSPFLRSFVPSFLRFFVPSFSNLYYLRKDPESLKNGKCLECSSYLL